MLTVVELANSELKRQKLDEFDPQHETWIVSDITSKIEVQRHLLARYRQIEDGAVLRASEFWRRLVWLHFPEWRIVSIDLVRTLIRREIEATRIAWAQGPGAAHALAGQMPQFLPLFILENGEELLGEWLRQNPDSLLRWGHWYQLARSIWNALAREKVLPSVWLPAFLLSSDVSQWRWERPLKVDLSARLSQVELDLFKSIGRDHPMELVAPAPTWAAAFRDVLRPYERVGQRRLLGGAALGDLRVASRFQLAHFSSPLAEVKDAVATVRSWLDAGAQSGEIAIVAPDIEIYWPMLAPALEEEGVPVNKKRTIPLHGLRSVQAWLAQLRLEMGQISSADLELASFHRGQGVMKYDVFKRLFTNLYTGDQIEGVEGLKRFFERGFGAKEEMSRDEFLAAAAGAWPGDQVTVVERIVKQLVEDAPRGIRLSATLWFDWLEAWAGKIEMTIHESRPGIHCQNIAASEWLSVRRVYFVGLSEEAMKTSSPFGLNPAETAAIERDLGVILPSTEDGGLEFELRWLLDRQDLSGVLSVSRTDPAGQPLTPSRLWLAQAEDPKAILKNLNTPAPTRWDTIQKASLAAIANLRHWPVSQIERLVAAIEQDLGLRPLEKFAKGLRPRLSASQIENYATCPFIFAAGKVFHLSDWPAVDLDLDHFSRGRLIHAVFESLTEEPRRWDWSRAELEAVVDEACRRLEIPDLGLWSQLKAKFVETATRFLAAERNWRLQFPDSKTVARELTFSAAWSQAKQTLVRQEEASPEDLPFGGVIDRIDSDGQGEYVLLDYKSQTKDNGGIKSWLNQSAFQLALYMTALEQGLTDLPPGLVRGAFYYDARDFSRHKGMQLEGANRLVPSPGRRGTQVTPSELAEIQSALLKRVDGLVGAIAQGEFAPHPVEFKECQKCQWRQLCRAPHLH